MNKSKPAKKLTMLGFFSVTVTMVMDVYEYPIFASSGLQLVFFLFMGGLLWFVPTALCSAEMATVDGWETGGIFAWVKNTLGERYGFAAIFFQWFQVTIGFVTMLYFIVSAIAYVLNVPEIDSNPIYKFLAIMVIFWLLTLLQFGGTKYTEMFGKIGFLVGIVTPALILFGLATAYILKGGKIQLDLTPSAFIPDFSKPSTLVVFISFILSYMGIEASASYVNELENPAKNYPLAMLLVVSFGVIANTIGGLSIAIVIPQADLSLSGGIMQALRVLFSYFGSNLGILVNLVSLMIVMGVLGEITGWIVGPARGMFAAAQAGLLPAAFRKVNKHNVPIPIILVQGIFVTLWAIVLTFGAGGNNLSFQIAIALTTLVYLIAYLLFYSGYFVLLFKKRDLKRGYQVPGGQVGKFLIATCGTLASIICLILSFIPPDTLQASEQTTYLLILAISFLAVLSLPFLIYHLRGVGERVSEKPIHLKASEVNRFIDPIGRGEHKIIPRKSRETD